MMAELMKFKTQEVLVITWDKLLKCIFENFEIAWVKEIAKIWKVMMVIHPQNHPNQTYPSRQLHVQS